jgi:hypothetical protein
MEVKEKDGGYELTVFIPSKSMSDLVEMMGGYAKELRVYAGMTWTEGVSESWSKSASANFTARAEFIEGLKEELEHAM